MAENESLDLGSPNARRWDEIYNGIRDGLPWEKVAPKVSKKLHDALRKVFKQLAKKGVAFEQLLAARESPGTLNQLVKQSGNHPYAVLFRDVCLSESTIIGHGESPLPVIEVLRRYRQEWLTIAAEGIERGWDWAKLVVPTTAIKQEGMSHASA